jgi:predicted PhzF superfamily epimerase YddE/YHI9
VATVDVVRVFTTREGTGGNPLGIVLYGAQAPAQARQALAAELGFSETVFLDDPATGRLQIFTPATELPFAGHPLVGTAWRLAQMGQAVDTLRPPAGEVATWTDDHGRQWIRGRAEWVPDISFEQHPSPSDVESLEPAAGGADFVDAWAWADEAAGIIRSRVFAPAVGIPEDEATGAAAVGLVARLNRQVTIRQGRGSEIFARPGPDGTVEIGGRCAIVETRDQPVPAV